MTLTAATGKLTSNNAIFLLRLRARAKRLVRQGFYERCRSLDSPVYVPNAIIFVLGSNFEDAMIPKFRVDSLVTSTNNCIAVGTQPYVDRPVFIQFMATSPSDGRLMQIAIAHIEAPGGKLRCVTAENEVIAEHRVDGELANVEVWVDDPVLPSEVVFVASAQRNVQLKENTTKEILLICSQFISGRDTSLHLINRLECLIDDAFADDEFMQETVVMLASYRPGGGEYLHGEQQIRDRLERLVAVLSLGANRA